VSKQVDRPIAGRSRACVKAKSCEHPAYRHVQDQFSGVYPSIHFLQTLNVRIAQKQRYELTGRAIKLTVHSA
jgi:hypothetical protein